MKVFVNGARGVLAALTISATLICAGQASADTTIKLGWPNRVPTPQTSIFVVMDKLGYLHQEGLKSDLQFIGTSASDTVKQVAAGNLFAASASPEPVMLLNLQNVKVRIVYAIVWGALYDVAVPVDSPIRTIADLKGKKIGVETMASAAVWMTRGDALTAGLDPEKDLNIMAIGSGAAAAAFLKRNEVDAVGLYPAANALIGAAGVPLRVLPTPETANFPANGLVVTEDTLNNHRDEATGLGRALAKAIVFTETNPEAALRILYDAYPTIVPTSRTLDQQLAIDLPILKAYMLQLRPEASGSTQWGQANISAYDTYEQFLAKVNVIPKVIPAENFVTNALIPDINKFDQKAIEAQAANYK
jgi:NitT/TauT family transport system substrate-binding protein